MLPELQSNYCEPPPDRQLRQEHGLPAGVLGKLLSNVSVKRFSVSASGKGRAWTIFKSHWQEPLTSLKMKTKMPSSEKQSLCQRDTRFSDQGSSFNLRQ